MLLLSALMFLSCAKQEVSAEDVVGNDPTLTGKLISVGIVPQDDSRTEVSVAGKVVWKLGDHIAVFVGGVAKDFSLISGAGSEPAASSATNGAPAAKMPYSIVRMSLLKRPWTGWRSILIAPDLPTRGER